MKATTGNSRHSSPELRRARGGRAAGLSPGSSRSESRAGGFRSARSDRERAPFAEPIVRAHRTMRARQVREEDRSAARCVDEADVAAHLPDDLLHDAQAQPGALLARASELSAWANFSNTRGKH
jgi:hypothetical protein